MIIFEEVSVTKKMYGWSKWGGARKGVVREELDEWSCQLCGDRFSKNVPCYFLPEDKFQREYFRVCSLCKRISIARGVPTFEGLMALKLANLLSLPNRISHG